MSEEAAAARILGIGKTTLYRKLKQYHMEAEEQNETAQAAGG